MISIIIVIVPAEKVTTGNGPPKFIEKEKGERNAESPYHNPHDCLKDKNKKSFHFKLFNVISKNR